MREITIKTDEEIAIMREAGQILSGVMQAIEDMVAVGVSGNAIDAMAESMIIDAGCESAFKGYGADEGEPFPATICFSINDGIVHGIPSERVIADGDVVKIDIGLRYNGYYADMARSFLVGNVTQEARELVDITRKAFHKGLATIKHGSSLYDYAHAVEQCAQSAGFHMVKNLVGHGIGRALHEPPQIPNYTSKNMNNFTFKKGMVVALEPMVNVGTDQTSIDPDGWTFVTADGSLSAHYENTICVTEKGSDILTRL
jgi:methionyl aminopeptidase